VIVKLKKETNILRKRLINKTIQDVECYHSQEGDSYIKIEVHKGSVVIGANDLGVWVASDEEMKKASAGARVSF
jgi:hypothetical protein